MGEWNTNTDPDCQVLRNGVKACADPHLNVGIEKIHVHPDYDEEKHVTVVGVCLGERNITSEPTYLAVV